MNAHIYSHANYVWGIMVIMSTSEAAEPRVIAASCSLACVAGLLMSGVNINLPD